MSKAGEDQRQEQEYRYIVETVAAETFTNLMLREGIDVMRAQLASQPQRVFTCDRLLDMRVLKERGIISSYSIIKIVRTEELVEQG